jgi:hypothetical protein
MAQEGWSLLAHPSLLGEPFVLSSADRAIGAGEEHRQSLETRGLDVETRRNFASRLRTSEHDHPHQLLQSMGTIAWPPRDDHTRVEFNWWSRQMQFTAPQLGRSRSYFPATGQFARNQRRECSNFARQTLGRAPDRQPSPRSHAPGAHASTIISKPP